MSRTLTLFVGLFCLSGLASLASSSCDVGWEAIGNGCFKFEQAVRMDWNTTVTYCSDMGASVAKVEDANTFEGLLNYIDQYMLSGDYWLGGSDLKTEGNWIWQDLTRVERNTPFWALHSNVLGWSLEPTGGAEENCLAMVRERFYFFDDRNCDELYHPICMKQLAQK